MAEASLRKEIGKKKPFDCPEQEAYLSIMRTASILSGTFERLFKDYGLTEAMYNALRILRGSGERGAMCLEIGEQLVSRVPDVTRLVDRLEKAGLAERVRSTTDRRVIFVKITKKGRDSLAKLDAPVLRTHKEQMGHVGRGDLAQLSKLLVKARESQQE